MGHHLVGNPRIPELVSGGVCSRQEEGEASPDAVRFPVTFTRAVGRTQLRRLRNGS